MDFKRNQRGRTTILFGGLTEKHNRLIQGALEGLGYQAMALPTPSRASFQEGKRHCNPGQCNPTYFTIGNLLSYLLDLHENHGIGKRQIEDEYVYLTAGACGPCRFGMYESEYRLALRNAGFAGFRVIVFQQKAGFIQSGSEAGIEMNPDFFLAILNAIVLGDLLNHVGNRIRPYEIISGETERVLQSVTDELYRIMKTRRPLALHPKLKRLLAKFPRFSSYLFFCVSWLRQLMDKTLVNALRHCYSRLADIKVDFTRVAPVVKITGEFWAQTTEGDGNFKLFAFLEKEKAQILVEPVATWIMYLLHQSKQKIRDRTGLPDKSERDWEHWSVWKSFCCHVQSWLRLFVLSIAEQMFKTEWHRLSEALGSFSAPLTDQYVLQRMAQPHYNSRASGGEGHLEVAKNIYYSTGALCHMVLSVKPFGCMPSTQSDGVQSALINHYKNMLYIPIETSGEGEVNAHSRIQMALSEAGFKAQAEFEESIKTCRHSLSEVQAFIVDNKELQRAGVRFACTGDRVGIAASYVKQIDQLMNSIRR